MRNKAKDKKAAEERAAILWKRYHQNDGIITCAEVLALTGKHSSNLDIIFQAHGVKGPTVWDSHKAIRMRQIDSLWAKSKELGRDWLTSLEVAKAVGIKTKDVSRFKKRFTGIIPEIRHETRQGETIFHDTSGMDRVEIGSPYAFKCWKTEPGPELGQTTYFLL